MSHALRSIHLIVNPASGGERPVLKILNAALHACGLDWELFVTQGAGDAFRYAAAALEDGVDAVGVYGGDGTIMEVATALAGQATPVAILPGGTANIVAVELGIPADLAQACGLVCAADFRVRAIDVGQMGDHIFLTRVGLGLEAAVVEATNREQKDRMGWLAYALNTVREMSNPQVSRYDLTIDGARYETEGLLCLIANSGIILANAAAPGGTPVRLAPTIRVDDGLLDVVVIRPSSLGALLAMAANMVTNNAEAEPLLHWQGREITVEAHPPQSVQLDGEVVGRAPVAVRVRPQALHVIVPAAAKETAGRGEAAPELKQAA
jgi:YegS/Rv2252/BmrU family lipid kinase